MPIDEKTRRYLASAERFAQSSGGAEPERTRIVAICQSARDAGDLAREYMVPLSLIEFLIVQGTPADTAASAIESFAATGYWRAPNGSEWGTATVEEATFG